MTSWWLVLAVLLGVYAIAVLEEWTMTGRIAPSAPLRSGLALLGRESLVPRQPDRVLFELAPLVLLIAAVLSLAVLPLAPGLLFADLATGALFVNAALAYVMVAVVMAGWAPNAPFALVAGWRFLGQLVAYSMLIVMPITAVGMRAQSLATSAVVDSQAPLWNVVAQPLGFGLFSLAALAVAFLPPFDLPIAPSELAGGVFGEYTGARLVIVRLGRLVLVLSLAMAVTVFYLGGWLGPMLPHWAWTSIKVLAVAATMLSTGRYLPRVTIDLMLAWAWKLGIPLALVNILWVGITLLLAKSG